MNVKQWNEMNFADFLVQDLENIAENYVFWQEIEILINKLVLI